MKRHKVILPIIFAVSLWVVSCFLTASAAPRDEQQNPTSGTAQRDAAAAAAFEAMLPVLRHPRCMNCHSAGDFPRQGDDSHPHAMNVRRGLDGRRSAVSRLSQLSGIAYSRSLELLYSFLLIPSFTKGSAGDQAGVEPFHPELNLSR